MALYSGKFLNGRYIRLLGGGQPFISTQDSYNQNAPVSIGPSRMAPVGNVSSAVYGKMYNDEIDRLSKEPQLKLSCLRNSRGGSGTIQPSNSSECITRFFSRKLLLNKSIT